nr:hypothetical protein [Butyrivibrio sp. WCD2001]
MSIELKPVERDDVETLWKMQVEAFSGLLEKYHDYDMSPAAESMDKVVARFEQPWTTYFFIMADGEKAGAVRVIDKRMAVESVYRLSGLCRSIGIKDMLSRQCWKWRRYTDQKTGAWTLYYRKREIFIFTRRWGIIRPEK